MNELIFGETRTFQWIPDQAWKWITLGFMTEPVRIDRWLWAARFFKTRGLARKAIEGGKIHLRGRRVKPSKAIQPGDRLQIQRGEELFDIEITGLSTRRGPAEAARRLYTESEESILARAQRAEQLRLQRSQDNLARHSRRPDKRQRRQIRQFKQR